MKPLRVAYLCGACLPPQRGRRGLRNGPALTLVLALGLGILAVPLAAGAQQAGRMYHLGILSPTAPASPSDPTTFLNRLPTALRELGYAEGQNLVVEWRYAEGNLDHLPALARELVQLRVDLILAVSNPAIRAAREATTTIPIVMFTAYDPVAAGLVASLARPGGNITGVLIAAEGTLAGKRLELLKEAVPRAARIALLAPPDASSRTQVQEAQKAAPSLGVKLVVVEVQGGDYDRAFDTIVAARPGALFVLASTFFVRDRKQIIDLAAKHRLPAIYEWREHVEDGGLMAYGSSLSRLTRRVAAYVDRIFKGEKPAELPIEQPTKFELIINLKTAKALGLTIPQSLLLRADEVIQ